MTRSLSFSCSSRDPSAAGSHSFCVQFLGSSIGHCYWDWWQEAGGDPRGRKEPEIGWREGRFGELLS